jgi:two-component system, NarL family, nitrate/nitrite response regulator NarP
MRLLIAAGHADLRTGIRRSLEARADFEVVGEAEVGVELASLVAQISPDIVLLDTEMPGIDGWTCLAQLQTRFPQVGVIVLVADPSAAELQSAFERGAQGVMIKARLRSDTL